MQNGYDKLSRASVKTSLDHNRVHEGQLVTAHKLDLLVANLATTSFVLVLTDADFDTHLKMLVSSEAKCQIDVYKAYGAPPSAYGIPVDVYRKKYYADVTFEAKTKIYDSQSGGTFDLMDSFLNPAGVKNFATGGSRSQVNETILEGGEVYEIIVTSQAGSGKTQDIDIRAEWYEENNTASLGEDFGNPAISAASVVTDEYILRYKLDGSDSTLVRAGGDDFRGAPAYPEAVGSWFDGSSQNYNADADAGSLAGLQTGFSISFWANSVDTGLGYRIISAGGNAAGSNGFYIRTNIAGKPQVNSNGIASSAATVVTDGKWHFWVISYDGTDLTIYIDNVLDLTDTRTFNTLAPPTFKIGANSSGGPVFWRGGLDDIRVYDRLLTTTERAQIYAQRVLWTPADLTTEAWYDAQDQTTITEAAGAVSQWDDKSGGGNDVAQAVGGNQPLTDSVFINGLNALTFDGTDYLQVIAAALGNVINGTDKDYIIYLVSICTVDAAQVTIEISPSASATNALTIGPQYTENEYRNLIRSNAVANYFVDSPNEILNTPFISAGAYDGAIMRQYINGNSFTGGGPAGPVGLVTGADRMTIGANRLGGVAHTGQISEVIVMNAFSPEAERQRIEGYLAWKWGLVADLPGAHPYKTQPPRT